jgi:short-subunit dehydrogenase
MRPVAFAGARLLITGAGHGLGRALALAAVREGVRSLHLVDKDNEALSRICAEIAHDSTIPVRCDPFNLADKPALDAWLAQQGEEVELPDIVINNAGYTTISRAEDQPEDSLRRLMDVNFFAAISIGMAFLSRFSARKQGVLVNVSSAYGLVGAPCQSAYCASKFALRGYTEALMAEVHGTGVGVAVVFPGGVRSGIVQRAEFISGLRPAMTHATVQQIFDKVADLAPEKAAAQIIRALSRGQQRIIIGRSARFVDRLQRLLPDSYRAAMRWIFRGA